MRYVIFGLSLAFFSACQEKDTIQEQPDLPPNIVLVLTDDQGWGDLSISGNANLSTPNIDALAADGATLDRFYVCPVCSPTRAELLTGRYHTRGGVYSTSTGGERLDLDETTLAEILKEAGYRTAAFGKWHNGMQYPYHPNGRGFNEYYGFCSGHWGNYFSPMLERNGELVKGNGFVIDDFTSEAMSFMEKNREGPFFVYLPFNTPHSPMQVPDRWWDKFKDKDLELRHRDPEKEDVLHTRAALAMCENIDWNVGRLQEKISELDLQEQTIFIYLSDNGPNGYRWNGGMKGRKGHTDEGGVRSPLFIKWQGKIKEGTKVETIAGAIDLLPTLAEMAKVPTTGTKPLDGISLRPLLLDEHVDWPDRTLISHWRGKTSVRSQQYRLGHQGQLFDMMSDPGQEQDLSRQLPDVKASLEQVKVDWEKNVWSELPKQDLRTFPLGHPDFAHTQIPARDGKAHGNIERSNRFPNNTFFSNWKAVSDSITWEIEVVESGTFEVDIYYTCAEENLGSTFEISVGNAQLEGTITEAHDPPLTGMEHDRVERQESYVKDFRPLTVGQIHLEQGTQQLVLKALEIPGQKVMDFRLMMFHRI
ncbi:MAG: arylsulfatase [Saprospiraceae bacterium]|nr:arylsulfatase [Saprospiraceae bacterium]